MVSFVYVLEKWQTSFAYYIYQARQKWQSVLKWNRNGTAKFTRGELLWIWRYYWKTIKSNKIKINSNTMWAASASTSYMCWCYPIKYYGPECFSIWGRLYFWCIMVVARGLNLNMLQYKWFEWNRIWKWTTYIALNKIWFTQHLFHIKWIFGTIFIHRKASLKLFSPNKY